MKLFKLLMVVLAGMTLTVATGCTAQACRTNHARTTKRVKKTVRKPAKRVAKKAIRKPAKKVVRKPAVKPATPNYAYTLTQGRGHVINLTNTGRTENLYRVTEELHDGPNGVRWYYMALNPRQTWTIKHPRKFVVTVRRVSKADEIRNANPRNNYHPLGIFATQRTLWSR